LEGNLTPTIPSRKKLDLRFGAKKSKDNNFDGTLKKCGIESPALKLCGLDLLVLEVGILVSLA